MVVLVEPDDREGPSQTVEPGHGRASVQIPSQDLIWPVWRGVWVRVGRIEVGQPRGVTANRVDGLVREDRCHGSGSWIQQPEARLRSDLVEVDSLPRVEEDAPLAAAVRRRGEDPIATGCHLNIMDSAVWAGVGVVRAVRRNPAVPG